ncbi:DNA mismatch repair protein MutS [Jeotgalicoccus saudimassiliensis]|uniref:DNA mismatch repair protein MutS n=1 Tax=Jeotgalicoccus saudimassiliensis TaxID=1461582 RepID=A0A078M3A3_9STAP|nr:hypothetical protein [Jeotgalicoccus saudimassiliensis]CEA02058.1 DNA mismatch repair protein MutS [Jeotgalicoccus saudimassiliensis]
MIVIQTLYILIIVMFLIMIVSLIIKILEQFKLKKDVKDLWNRKQKYENRQEYYIHHHNYFVNMMENEDTDHRHVVDDETWKDLDMARLLEKMNYTFTTIGAENLYAALRNAHETDSIDEELIIKIKNDEEFRRDISYRMAELGRSGNTNTSKFMYEFRPVRKYNPLLLLCSIMPIAGALLFFVNPYISLLLILTGFSLNAYFSTKHKSTTGLDYTDIFYAINIIVTAGRLNKKYNSKGLKRLSILSPLFVNDDSAKEMNVGVQMFAAFKLMFLIDYHLFHIAHGSLRKNYDLYKAGWRYTADLDLHYSLAMWRETLPYYTTPASEKYLVTEGLYHPLVESAVDNDFSFNNDILLTGSNAAGKSTFMKALGVNVILSNGLNTSTASTFKYTPGKVTSSMEITDSVIEGDSYFISEVKSLKRIVEEIEDFEGRVYCIIDEIFKGTNTIERLAAGESFLRYLHDQKNVDLIAATHDMELTNLLNGELDFYHFSETLIDDDIEFDYKIKPGIATSSNAIELLRLYGFPEAVYKNARSKVSGTI